MQMPTAISAKLAFEKLVANGLERTDGKTQGVKSWLDL
jgi:hypothetical protein